MTCLQPITAWKKKFSDLTQNSNDYYRDKKLRFKDPNNDNWEKIQIACGHCLGCRLDHSNTWATRIALECKRHEENCFITLTYNNKNLPISQNGHMTLRKKDVQDFIKLLRYHIKKKILYFAVGEYGTTTFRPHYHIIIMGWKPKDLKKATLSKTENQMFTSPQLEEIWGNGFVAVEETNYKTACYVARYCQKKSGIKAQKRILSKEPPTEEIKIDERNGKPFIKLKSKYITNNKDIYGREKEFIVMSKKPAIGKTYWEQNKNKIIHNKGILLKVDDTVKLKPIPRYFKKIFLKENLEEALRTNYQIQTETQKNIENTIKKIQADDPKKTYLETLKTNLESRTRFLKRNQN